MRNEAWPAARVLAEIERIDLYDRGLRDLWRAERTALVPGLRALLDGPPGVALLNASVLLLHLGDPEGTRGLVRLIGGDDPGLQVGALVQVSVLPLQGREHEQAVPIDAAALWAALAPLVADPSGQTGTLAVGIAARLEVPGVADALAPLIDHADAAIRSVITAWLASHGEEGRALDALERNLLAAPGDGSEAYQLLGTLRELAAAPAPPTRDRARDLAGRFIRASLRREGPMTPTLVHMALAIAAGAADEADVLDAVVASRAPGWVRGQAIVRLAELDPPEAGLARLTAVLAETSDDAILEDAGRAVARLVGPTTSPELRAGLHDALAAATARTTHDGAVGALIAAVLAVTGPTDPLIDELAPRAAPWDRAELSRARSHLGVADIVAVMVEAGVIPTPSAEAIAALAPDGDPSLFNVFLELLGPTRVTAFDGEATIAPPDYAALVEDLGGLAAAAAVELTVVSQHPGPSDGVEAGGTVEVVIAAGSREHRFQLADHGDWYDVDGILAALGEVLAAAGRPERFVRIHTDDQLVLVAFAEPTGLRRAAARLGVPLDGPPHEVEGASG